MIPLTRFALARFSSYFNKQKEELLEINPSEILLYAKGAVLKRIPWQEIRQIEFIHHKIPMQNLIRMISGNLFQRREPRLILKLEDGQKLTYSLELDVEYRRAEMQTLFMELYRAGISLWEESSLGGRTFLLERMPENEINAKIKELRSPSEPPVS